MSLTLYLNPGTAPAGTQLPGTAQALIAFIAQYVGVGGTGNFDGINYGPNTPTADNRDKPWWRTDANNAPMGMYNWDGTQWSTVPQSVQNGTTANRPANPAPYTVYFDSTINCEIIFERSQWRTRDGQPPGAVKFVTGFATIADALTANPGWADFTDAWGRVLGAAGSGGGLTVRNDGDTDGEETHILTQNEIPSMSVTVPYQKGRADANMAWNTGFVMLDSGTGNSITASITGGNEAHNNVQPTLFLYCLTKL